MPWASNMFRPCVCHGLGWLAHITRFWFLWNIHCERWREFYILTYKYINSNSTKRNYRYKSQNKIFLLRMARKSKVLLHFWMPIKLYFMSIILFYFPIIINVLYSRCIFLLGEGHKTRILLDILVFWPGLIANSKRYFLFVNIYWLIITSIQIPPKAVFQLS